MAAKRKKWKVTYRGTNQTDEFTSEAKTYERVRSLARAYTADPTSMDPHLRVWVDDGGSRGWQLHDDPDLSEWGIPGGTDTDMANARRVAEGE